MRAGHTATLRRRAVLGLAAASLRLPAAAQPSVRPVSLVVPWPPGGITDVTARLFAEEAPARLGQRVIVENRSGAAGRVGSLAVARALPDGLTLLVQNATHPLTRVLDPRVEYDPVADFTAIARMSNTCLTLAVNPALPVRDLDDLRRHARGTVLNYGSIGIGSAHQLLMERLRRLLGAEMNHVPYRGEAPAIADLIAGRIGIMFLGGAKPHLDSGALRGLAVTSRGPWFSLPGLPPLRDTFPGFEFEGWNGLFGPARLPPEIVDRLNAVSNEVFGPGRARTVLREQGYDVSLGTPAEFAARVAADVAFWREIAEETRITLE